MATKTPKKNAPKKAARPKAASKKAASKMAPAKTVDADLAAAPKERRAALTKLRAHGESLMHFAYWKDHVALYGTSMRTPPS